MIYGEEKRLQMARSILPSRRSFRKEKQHLHRAARRALSTRLRSYDEEERRPLKEEPRGELAGLVRFRRALDKLAHFERWAERVTEALPEGARLSALRAVLPRGLIGQHALSHLRARDHFREPGELAIRAGERARWLAERAPLAESERLPLLRLVFARREAWERLCGELSAAHRTQQWPLARRPVEVAQRAGGWELLDPTQWRPVGRRRAPVPAGAEELEDYLSLILSAAAAPREVPAGPWFVVVRLRRRRGEWLLRRSPTLPNPESHPEWLAAVDAFLLLYRRFGGDLARVRRGY